MRAICQEFRNLYNYPFYITTKIWPSANWEQSNLENNVFVGHDWRAGRFHLWIPVFYSLLFCVTNITPSSEISHGWSHAWVVEITNGRSYQDILFSEFWDIATLLLDLPLRELYRKRHWQWHNERRKIL